MGSTVNIIFFHGIAWLEYFVILVAFASADNIECVSADNNECVSAGQFHDWRDMTGKKILNYFTKPIVKMQSQYP